MFSYLSESVSTLGHFRVTFASVSKRVFVRNHANENVFHLHVHFHANKTHFRLNGFAQGLVLKMRQKSARKWPIYNHDKICFAFFECCQNLLCNDIFTSVYCLVFNPCCTQRNIFNFVSEKKQLENSVRNERERKARREQGWGGENMDMFGKQVDLLHSSKKV